MDPLLHLLIAFSPLALCIVFIVLVYRYTKDR